MRQRYYLTLGLFLLTVRAEKEEFQGYLTARDTAVTKYLLLRKENTIGRGTAATPTENTHQYNTFKGAGWFGTGPTAPYGTTRGTKASATMASPSRELFVSRNGQNSLTLPKHIPPTEMEPTESDNTLISISEKVVFSSPPAAYESMMNGTSRHQVHLSTAAMKASPWLHTLLDNRHQRHSGSVSLTASAKEGLGSREPTLPAFYPAVNDNMATLGNDKDDNRSQTKAEKGISNLERKGHLFSLIQSVLQSETVEDSARRQTTANFCLTCLNDQRASAEKTLTLHSALSLNDALNFINTDGPALDFNQFETSLPSSPRQEATQNKDISDQNTTKPFSFHVREQLTDNATFPPSTLDKTVNHMKSTLNHSQIKTFLFDPGTAVFETQSLVDMSSVTQQDTKEQMRRTYLTETLVTQRPSSTTALPLSSSKSGKTGEQKISVIGDLQSKLKNISKNNKNISHSLSKHDVSQNQPLNYSIGSKINISFTAESQYSIWKSGLPESSDHSSQPQPTRRMPVTEDQSAITNFSSSRQTNFTVNNSESPSPTARADSLMSLLKSHALAKLSSQTKEPTMTLKDPAIKLASIITKRQVVDKHAVKQSFVDPPSSEIMKEPQTTTFQTGTLLPGKLFLSESRQDFDENVSAMNQTPLPGMSFSEGQTTYRLLGSQSKITQVKTFHAINQVAQTRQALVKYDRDLNSKSTIVQNLKPGDKNEQVLTVAAEDGDKEIETEGKRGKENKVTEPILRLQEEEVRRENEKLGNKSEELLQEKNITGGIEVNQNADWEVDRMNKHEANTSRRERGGTVGEGDDTLRQNKDPVQGEVRDTESAEKKGVTERRNPISHLAEEHRESFVTGDMTNVPFGSTTNSEELYLSKGPTVTNLSLCHVLIKLLGVTETNGIRLSENMVDIVKMKNKPFSHKVTSNHRPRHSTTSSQTHKLSKMTYFLREPYTQIKPHPSTHRDMLTGHGAKPSFAKESTQDKVDEAVFPLTAGSEIVPKLSQTSGPRGSKYSDAEEPTLSCHSSSTKSVDCLPNSTRDMLSLTAPVAGTAGFLQAKPYFTVGTTSRRLSIIHSLSDRNTFSAERSKANSPLKTTSKREQAEHITPAHIFGSRVKVPLTSNMIKEVNLSPSVNAALQMFIDSSSRPPEYIGQLQVQQGKSTSQKSQSTFSSSSSVTSEQPLSFKLSERTAQSHALYSPVDHNKLKSVQTLMTSVIPTAKNDQFPISTMSPLLNLTQSGGLPASYSLMGLTRTAAGKNILRDYSGTGGSGHAESSLWTADETNQTEENDSVQMTVTLTGKHTIVITNQIAENGNEKNTFLSIVQTIDSGKHNASDNDEFKYMSVVQTEKLAEKNTDENPHEQLNMDRNNEANLVLTTLENNPISHTVGYNVTSTEPIVFATQTNHRIEPEIEEDFLLFTNDLARPVLDTDDQTGTSAFFESDSVHKLPTIESHDVTSNSTSHIMEHHAAKTNEKEDDLLAFQEIVGEKSLPFFHIDFGRDLKLPNTSTQHFSDQMMNVTSEFQITTTKTDDFVSLISTPIGNRVFVPRVAHESTLPISESVQVVTEKLIRAAHLVMSDSNTESLSPRGPLTTPAADKFTHAVRRENKTKTPGGEQTEHKISVQDIEQRQHASPDMISLTRPLNDPTQGVQTDLLNSAAGVPHSMSTAVKRVEYSPLEDYKAYLTTKGLFEHQPQTHIPSVHTPDRGNRHTKHVLPEKTSRSHEVVGAVLDSVPPRGFTPSEDHTKTSCRTIDCATAGEISEATIAESETDDNALEKMFNTKAEHTGRNNSNAMNFTGTKPETHNCSSDCPGNGKATLQATNFDLAVLSTATSEPDRDHANVDGSLTKNANSITFENSTKSSRVLVEMERVEMNGTLEQAQLEEHTKTQLKRRVSKAEIFESQHTTRSVAAMSKGDAELLESGHRLLVPEPAGSELSRLKHQRKTSTHLYLSGVTKVWDDLCGSGNYTAEMSLDLGTGVKPGDAVPALGNLRVVINLKTNNSQIDLQVTSCCLSPSIQPHLSNSTCCLFSRLAAEPAGITLLPSDVSTSASFAISPFQMINYSVAYLHCDLRVCPRNRSGCERQCLWQRSAFPSEGPEAVVTNLQNRISFGPILKEKNPTFLEELDPSELDLVLVAVSLAVGSSLLSVMLLLVWLAYRHRHTPWLSRSSSAPPQPACCSRLRPDTDLLLP